MGAILTAQLAGLAACAHVPPAGQGSRPGATLRSFHDAAELQAYHVELVEAILSKPPLGSAQVPPPALPPPRPPGDTTTPPEPEPEPEPAEARIYGDPIVRAHGDYLLVLREGRLHTIRAAGGALEPVAAVDALGPGVSRENALFADLFVSGDTAWVRASRSAGKTTENHVVLFRVGRGGGLEHLDADVLHGPLGLHAGGVALLRGGKLVLYDDVEVPVEDRDVFAALPSLRRPDGGRVTTAAPERIYRSVYPMSWPHGPELHVVTVCGWKAAALDCASTAAYAPRPTVVHVSANAVYLWSEFPYAVEADENEKEDENEDEDEYRYDREALYRMPLDGSVATALPVTGASIFRSEAFLESADGYLNALVTHDGWTREDRSRTPALTLLRAALPAFGDGRGDPAPQHYRRLPRPAGRHLGRFVGEWLLYGNRFNDPYLVDAGLAGQATHCALGLGLARWADTTAPAWYPIRAPTLALEPLREDAALALLGSGDSTVLSYLRLGPQMRAAGVARSGIDHWEGAMRGIVHYPDGPESGLLGIPIGVRPNQFSWRATAAAILRYDSAAIRQLGEIAPRGELTGEREVVPAFAHGRIFVLLGSELVEAVEENGALREVRRIVVP